MKPNSALQTIFAVFLGLVVVAFVGIAVNTFYPQPPYPEYPSTPDAELVWQAAQDQWYLVTGIVLLLLATIILAVSLFLPDAQAVLSNGILLGGVFTMIYAVGMTFSADTSWLRLAVITVALVVTITVGYLKFARGNRPAESAQTSIVTQPDGTLADQDGSFNARLAAVEAKLNALGNALRN